MSHAGPSRGLASCRGPWRDLGAAAKATARKRLHTGWEGHQSLTVHTLEQFHCAGSSKTNWQCLGTPQAQDVAFQKRFQVSPLGTTAAWAVFPWVIGLSSTGSLTQSPRGSQAPDIYKSFTSVFIAGASSGAKVGISTHADFPKLPAKREVTTKHQQVRFISLLLTTKPCPVAFPQGTQSWHMRVG